MGPGLLERLISYLPLLGQGALITIEISAAAIGIGFLLGSLLLAISEKSNQVKQTQTLFQQLCAGLVSAYVSFFRGTPLLVQLLMLFYLPTAFGINLPPFPVAILAMGLNSAAFQTEILRAGLSSVAPGQLEAAASFGIPQLSIFRFIQFPQIIKPVWPAVISEAVDVMKSSAIVSVIAVTDLARTARQIVAGNFRPLEVYLAMGLLYLALTGAVYLFGYWLGNRLSKSANKYSNKKVVADASGSMT